MSRYSDFPDTGVAEMKLAQEGPGRQTRRQNLEYRRKMVQMSLDDINKAIAALDAHPDLEDFIETLAKAGA